MKTEISPEEIKEIIAQKALEQFSNENDVNEIIENVVGRRVEELIADKLEAQVSSFLQKTMEDLVNKELCPVDIFGEPTGEPTTIRNALFKRAKDFWETKVNEEGRPYSYGESRSEKFMRAALGDAFNAAVKANAEQIIKAFKDAIKNDSVKLIHNHIDKLIQVK